MIILMLSFGFVDLIFYAFLFAFFCDIENHIFFLISVFVGFNNIFQLISLHNNAFHDSNLGDKNLIFSKNEVTWS